MLYRLSYAGQTEQKCSPGRASVAANPAGEHLERRIEWRTRSAT